MEYMALKLRQKCENKHNA